MAKIKKEDERMTTISISFKNWKELNSRKKNPRDSMEAVVSELIRGYMLDE